MKLTTIIKASAFACGLSLFIQCGGKKNEPVHAVHPEEAEEHEAERDVTEVRDGAGKPKFSVDEVFRKQVTEVFDEYVQLKDAFVDSDPKKVQKEAEDAMQALNKVDKSLVSGEPLNDWTQYSSALSESLKSLQNGQDIEAQRAEFSELSDTLYKTLKSFGLSGKTAYYEFCPMAFDDKGAYWLSNEEKIRNPYFGDKMLTCGSVEETIQ